MAIVPMTRTLQSVASTDRVQRRPKHKFRINAQPYAITPFMIAPVLPGETYQGSWTEAREVSRPIKSSIIGWSSEWFMFYVRIRDLDNSDTLDDLFIEPAANISALNTAADPKYYHRGGSPNYTQMCLKRVVETYFRDEGEAWNIATIDGYPAAQQRDFAWMDTLMDTTQMPEGVGNPAVDGTTPEAMDRIMDAYEYLRAMSLVDMEFEDYLATFGVRVPKVENRKPVLLHSWREFQYPSNTVEPTTGVPSAALSWVHKSAHTGKGTFIKEPGFVIGVHVIRPKVYYGRQFGSMVHHLDTGLSWLPAIMRDSPETSLREFTGGAAGNGPLSNGTVGPTNGYWVDLRDLFLYGDQFTNVTGDPHAVALPTAALGRKYVSQADVDNLFVGVTAATRTVETDGFTTLTIKGMQRDHTPTVNIDGL